ncbi:hypothetical protein HID58_029062 [Brassica napus]|uniref:Uncharacterized protein n=1 Tax=Brassica napus TaxID=3708 RepID=A0ABQ8CE55_BRANA|nr:hypothetical protein HID58_029062 [Brassica napus]
MDLVAIGRGCENVTVKGLRTMLVDDRRRSKVDLRLEVKKILPSAPPPDPKRQLRVMAIEEMFKHRVTNVVLNGDGHNKYLCLMSHKYDCKLACYVVHPNREKNVPNAKSYPLEAVVKDCRGVTTRRISFEYALLGLIPYNPIHGRANIKCCPKLEKKTI